MKLLILTTSLSGDIDLNVAVLQLVGYINNHSEHTAEIIDFTFHRKSYKRFLRHEIEKKSPDIIGISFTTITKWQVEVLIDAIKRINDIPILLGGSHCILDPDDSIRLKGVDYICCTEAESVLVEFLDSFEKGKRGKDLAFNGIWSKVGDSIYKSSGKYYQGESEILDFSLYEELEKFLFFTPYLPYLKIRGCPYSCTFCASPFMRKNVNGKYYRFPKAKEYVSELVNTFKKYGENIFMFALTDIVFTQNDKWFYEFSEHYEKSRLGEKVALSIMTRADALNEKKIKILKRMNCIAISLGMESGDQTILDRLGKRESLEDIRKAIELCKKYSIKTIGFFMLGTPWESYKSLSRTIRFIFRERPDMIQVFPFYPFPNTEIVKNLKVVSKKNKSSQHFGAIKGVSDISALIIDFFELIIYIAFYMPVIIKQIISNRALYFRLLVFFLRKAEKYEIDYFTAFGYFTANLMFFNEKFVERLRKHR